MKNEKINILIVNDYPLVCEAYKKALKNTIWKEKKAMLEVTVVSNNEGAMEIIKEFKKKKEEIDLVFLDLKPITSSRGKLLTGEDIGGMIREHFNKTKIIVSTENDSKYQIHGVFKKINPDGFLMENDLSFSELEHAINEVIKDPPYYSKNILKLLRKKVSTEFILDEVDRKILYELSIGAKVKDMLESIPLSVAAIEKRKRHLKRVFNVEEKGHRELILKAKENGFI